MNENKIIYEYVDIPNFSPLSYEDIILAKNKISSLKQVESISDWSWMERLNWGIREYEVLASLYQNYPTIWNFCSKETMSKKEEKNFNKMMTLYKNVSNGQILSDMEVATKLFSRH